MEVGVMCRSVDALSYAIDQRSQGGAPPETNGIGDEASAAIVADYMRQILRQHDPLQASGLYQDLLAHQQSIFQSLMPQLQASAEQLQGLLDRNSLPDVPEYCRQQPTPAHAQNIITYAHKLCYTTFAPPGYEVGVTPLRHFRPPMPQEWQLRASQLYAQNGLSQQQDAGTDDASAAAAAADAGVAPAALTPQPMDVNLVSMPGLPEMPLGWKPGDPLPHVPPIPPGWKPGDAIPGEDAPKAATIGEPAEPCAPEPAQEQVKPRTELSKNDAFNFILNPDWESVEEDFSEEESE